MIEYLNEESQNIFNNDIGDTLTIDKNIFGICF